MTLTSDTSSEKTEVFDTLEDIVACAREVLSRIRKTHDLCLDKWGPSAVLGNKEVKDAFIAVTQRGGKIRLLTEISTANEDYCSQFMKFAGVRHLDKVKGNFSVSDEMYYTASSISEKDKPPQRLIYSTVKEIVEQHQYFFETLWDKAIPASQRIAEIGEGIEPEFVEVITDGSKAAELIVEFAKSVSKEAQLILPQPKTMERAGKLGMWDYLIDAANNKGADIKVISPLTEENAALAKQIMDKAPGIKILSGPVSASGLFIHDERRYYRAEDRNPDAADAVDAVSRVIYSNSRNGVQSFKSFFDTLWKQSELSEQLHLANEKLLTRDKLQKEFINIAAHELRTPMQPILGIADILQDRIKEKDGEKGVWLAQDDLDIVVRNAKRLERLSTDILDIARIESGNLHLNIETVDLNEMVAPLVQEAKSEAANSKVEIQYKPPSHNIVRADKDRLAQVIWNLLNNALKFTETGTVSIEGRKDDDRSPLFMIVNDSGTGIDPEILPRLFTKFATKSNKGTGLGLYITKKIIEAHGGMISASNNKVGNGATFTVMLPAMD